jgi:hypothetical protein
MPLTSRLRQSLSPSQRPPRRGTPSCRGGASSLLRLAQPVTARLPSAIDLSGWISRAAGALQRPAAPPFAQSEFISG